MKGISLFSGMGGDSLGMANAGVELVAYSEKERIFRDTHDLNFPDCKVLGADVKSDVTKVPDEEFASYKGSVDIIFSGFPCQGFSQAGKKLPNDPRNTLFREFLRATRLIQPKYIIGENVKGLLTRKTAEGRNYIDVIVESFETIGYRMKYQVFKCEKYGIPQRRQRLIMVGVRNDIDKEYEFPEPDNVEVGIRDIVNFDMTGAIKLEKDVFDLDTLPPECVLEDLTNVEGENNPHPYLRLKVESVDAEWRGKVHKRLISFAKRDSPIHCEIVDIRRPTKTIICTYSHQPRLFVPLRNKNGQFLRMLLPDELKQIQSFPADYKMSGNTSKQIIQIGNAVPPLLIQKIVENI